jgi:tRNA uridine 5-carboxymethylaminomethyl modification enzyme
LLFLEPEGLNSSRVYVNGLSTSMPADVQDDVVHSIEGLEQAVIVQHGYAVEYDIADPRDLDHGLQHTAIAGLFLAGQVNGTSGYEEAAVQGFVAGVSAMAGTPFQLGRDEAYIGVLIDDLTSRGVGGEPYRMFTSRAEHRLLLREDNADSRLMQKGRDLGLIDDATWEAFQERAQCARAAKAALKTSIPPTPQAQKRMSDAGLGRLTTVRTAEEILRRPEADYDGVRIALAEWVNLPMLPKDVASQVAVEVKYAGYIARANRRARSADQLDAKRLPPDVDWMSIDALSWEVRERLRAAQPRTLGQIARLPGITPAAVNVVVAWLARQA